MKTKILIVLAICVLGLFWDDLAMRISHVERTVKDSDFLHARVDALEKNNPRIRNLEQKLSEALGRLALITQVTARNNLASQRFDLLSEHVFASVMREQGIKTFRTDPYFKNMQDVTIDSALLAQKKNCGIESFLSIGVGDQYNIRRTLIKFTEVAPGLLKDKKIVAAVLYLKQLNTENRDESFAALNETINAYAVRKHWNEGEQNCTAAQKGEVTWEWARTDEEKWSVPGCGSESDDFEPMLLATSGPVVSVDATEWVPVVFTHEGIEKLQAMIKPDAAPNDGFLLKLANEKDKNTFLSFGSTGRPEDLHAYLEIYFLDTPLEVPLKK